MKMEFRLPKEIVQEKPQYNSIIHEKGPLMIIAGPGSGKTKVLVWKTVKLLVKDGIPPEQIWLTTYTKKAARQLKAKISNIIKSMGLNIQVPKMLIGTIHSTCLQLIKEYPDYFPNIGYPVNVLDENIQLLFFLKHSRQLKLDKTAGMPSKRPSIESVLSIINHISWLIEYEINPNEYEKFILDQFGKTNDIQEEDIWMTRTYREYLKIIEEEGILDFGHILKKVADAIDKKKFDKEIAKRIRYILVDEYQDVNQLQQYIFMRVVKAIENVNITVVGDDDQAIYQFRGAGVGTLTDFEKAFQPTKEFLTKNFRSPVSIVNASSEFISTNPSPLRYEKKLEANLKDSKKDYKVIKVHKGTLLDSARELFKTLKCLLEKKRIRQYGDIVLLMRSIKPHHIEPYILALNELSIPYTVIGESGLFSTPVGISFLLFFDFLCDQNATFTEQFIRCKVLNLKEETIDKIEKVDFVINEQKLSSLNLFERDRELLKALINIHKNQSVVNSVLELTYSFLRVTNFLTDSVNNNENDSLQIISNITSVVFNYEDITPNNLENFTMYLKDLWQSGQADIPEIALSDPSHIKIMTVHQAKGLEFPIVIIGGAVKGRFPIRDLGDNYFKPFHLSKRPTRKESHEDEEKRLFYVAMTRAINLLLISTAEKVSDESKKKCGQTPWLDYISNNNLSSLQNLNNSIIGQIGKDYVYEEEVNVYSFSSLNYYDYCPFRYFIVRGIGIDFPIKGYFTIGSNIHKVLEYIHHEAIGGKIIKRTNLTKAILKYWIDVKDRKIPNERLIKSTEKLLLKYIKEFSGTFKYIIDVEKEFWIVLDSGIFTGKVDLIRKTKERGIEIVDFKTSTFESFDYKEQLKTYLMGIRYGFDIDANKACIHELKTSKLTNYSFKNKEIELTKDKINHNIKCIENKKFDATPEKNKCLKCELFEFDICPFAIK